jgi:hypothetical protein
MSTHLDCAEALWLNSGAMKIEVVGDVGEGGYEDNSAKSE